MLPDQLVLESQTGHLSMLTAQVCSKSEVAALHLGSRRKRCGSSCRPWGVTSQGESSASSCMTGHFAYSHASLLTGAQHALGSATYIDCTALTMEASEV